MLKALKPLYRRVKPSKGKSAYVKRKRASKAATARFWGLPTAYQTSNLRYQNPIEKGILWYWFSLYIRTRDVKRWGACISCGRAITVETCDAGHFVPAGSCGASLLFNERNVNAECSHCNAWNDMHLLGYAEGLDARYGPGTSKELRARKPNVGDPIQKNLRPKEYGELIKIYQTKLKELL